MKNIICIFISIIFFSAYGQSKLEIPASYKLVETPKKNSDEHRKLNNSKDIAIKLTGTKIKTYKTPQKTDSELKFNNGLLIGSDHGEWGGKLIYKKGLQETNIKKGNIKSLFEFEGNIYFLEGLAHLSKNYGEIYKLEYTEGKFNYKKILTLPDEPQVFQIYNKKIYIATFENFIVVNNWKIETEIKGFWDSLYPNSMIIENEN